MDIDFLGMLDAVWQVLVVGLLFGAGLPALFALGMRFAGTVPDGASADALIVTTAPGRVLSILCFAACVLVAVFGIVVIVFGTQIFGG